MGALPDGFGLVLDSALRRFRGGTVLSGGRPGRVVTLTPAGARSLDALVAGGAADSATADLAGRLVAAGMAHPRRPVDGQATFVGGSRSTGVTVVVPAYDRPQALDRCLASLGLATPVVVVDDASANPVAVADVCNRHGARVVHRSSNGGPGAARESADELVATELVAFVDSDCTVPDGWLDDLSWHFADPGVAAVAPRIRPATVGPDQERRTVHRFSWSHSPLDLGPDEGEVGPERSVRYVPTAALVIRQAALRDVGGFDPALRVGEDVDVVWRLVEAGWRIRYDPSVVVCHAEPDRWRSLLGRRLRYGTSAAPLAVRHPGRLSPVELRPRATAAAMALLTGRPVVAATIVASASVSLALKVRPLGIPTIQVWRWCAGSAAWTVMGLGRAATTLFAPGLVGLAVTGRRGRRAATALLLVPPIVDWVRQRPDLDLPRWVVASVADDLAYGAGVWIGCLRARTFAPLVPKFLGFAEQS